ncbi:hypothetical protein VTJ04DRAFT_6149 [Mycothermus thermophilus]|uniref:uncharacterized protein n=1 Tax=Humicola insolens TaxID=85995 RepID=UPI0037428B99
MQQLTPRTRRTPQNTQHTYFLHRRIYDAKTYPVRSPQGATILLYAHDNGVTVVWRGGRRLKPPKKPVADKRNGSSTEDSVVIIDSDDEAPAPAFVDKPEFEDQPTADAAVPDIIQTLDLSLGTAVANIAVLPMPFCDPDDAAWTGAKILATKMVFAVTCATTSDVYVVTLPLTPPSHESKERPELRKNLFAGNAGTGAWGETLTLLTGQNRPCGGLAISLVRPKPGSRSRSVERSAAQAAPPARAIVAAHSREASGTLRLWDVTLDAKPGTVNRVEPFQTEYLPAPLSGLSFNPTHLTQLLTVTPSQAVRIYDYATAALPSDDASEGPFPTQGSWLLSLYPPFARGPSMSTARKPIVAAEWIAQGRAILALLADGQWGIWDVDGASPSTGNNSLFSKANTGLRGSGITAFCVSGHLEGTSPLRNPVTQKASAPPGEFAPMTPHTRRDAMLAGLGGGVDKLAAVRGGISVARLPTQAAGPGEESAVLWLAGGVDPIVSVIPIISRFWDSQLRRAVGGGVNLWSGAQPTRMIRLTDLGLGLFGERCTGAVAIPKTSSRTAGAAASNGTASEQNQQPSSEGLPVEVLIRSETRLSFVHESDEGTSLTTRLLGGRKKARLEPGPPKAILAYSRGDKPISSQTTSFDMSFSQPRQARGVSTGRLFQPRGTSAAAAGTSGRSGVFEQHAGVGGSSFETIPDEAMLGSAPASQQQGLMFINDLELAADQPDDGFDAESRDIEQELMDIMEIDRELEQLEKERERGAKRVFFEEG